MHLNHYDTFRGVRHPDAAKVPFYNYNVRISLKPNTVMAVPHRLTCFFGE